VLTVYSISKGSLIMNKGEPHNQFGLSYSSLDINSPKVNTIDKDPMKLSIVAPEKDQ
jgi:hypothetical protein